MHINGFEELEDLVSSNSLVSFNELVTRIVTGRQAES